MGLQVRNTEIIVSNYGPVILKSMRVIIIVSNYGPVILKSMRSLLQYQIMINAFFVHTVVYNYVSIYL